MSESQLTPREEQHGRFVAALGNRLIWRYTDGGAGEPRGRRNFPQGPKLAPVDGSLVRSGARRARKAA